MSYRSYQDLLSQHGEDFVLECRVLANRVAKSCSYTVFKWDRAPEVLKKLCSQGGDEDWLVVTNLVEDMVPS